MIQRSWADYTEPTFIEVRGTRIAYRRKGAGQPLLFLHGGGLTRRWLPLYEHLSAWFDVIVPEHPGFGDSDLPDWLTDFTDMAVHYADFCDALDIGPAHVVGHSLGGWIAAEFAALYPERIRTLSLVAPMGLRPDADETLPDMYRQSDEQGFELMLGPDGPRWFAYFDEGNPAEQAIQDYKEQITAARLAWNPRYSLKLERRLGRVGAPAQVIVPERDGLFPPSIARRFSQALPNADLIMLKGESARTEHLLIVQEPARLAAQVAALAEKNP